MKPSYIITDSGINGVIDNKLFTVDSSHPNYQEVIQAVRMELWDEVVRLSNLARAVAKFTSGSDVVVDVDLGVVMYNGQELNNGLTDHILRMMSDGFNITPMTNFLRNLMKNPSSRAVDELYLFLEYGKLPITEDGCFIAYKRVQDDYYDWYSCTVCAKPVQLMTDDELADMIVHPKVNVGAQKNVTVEIIDGVTTISMPRNGVDDIAQNTCSKGLHFCSHEYLKSFVGERVIIMKINPADVVSIPNDYHNTKGRTWKYQVVGELNEDMKQRAESENVLTQSVYQADKFDEDNWSPAYTLGYKEGHQDGRSHSARRWYADHCKASHDDLVKGYGQGYLDGKNKNYDIINRLKD